MKRLASFGAAVCLATTAQAGCEVFDALERNSKSAPENAACATYLGDNGSTGTSCHWTFAFRDAEALIFADALWQSLNACRAGKNLGPDQQVNHPDSYVLREWSTATGTYAISVKDKGGLDQTLVFLRFEPR